ncbi:MAG: type I-E CRISPR-associated endonuclease Cas1e [Corynebacterium sp.]|nr:type I-E CRISPR-associated endonuclease Cas1e [Corynebacterium sp.]
MAYSDEAVTFSTIPADHQVRLEDRVSFLYLERCSIRQDKTGVVAYSQVDGEALTQRIQIPVGGISLLMLGPGTSISSAAATSCARSGATVMFTGGGGVPSYTHATPLTSSARWAIAQAHLVANEAHQRKAAVKLYRRQLALDDLDDSVSISVMRGMEGRVMKQTYQSLAKKHGIKNFRRNTAADDPINQGLNLANSMLYGCAASASTALSLNPALGIIHRGNSRALLFDLADLYKPILTMPLAFACADKEEPSEALRKELRREIHRRRLLKDMIQVLMEILTPHLPNRDDDRLISGRGDEVSGHTQYGSR